MPEASTHLYIRALIPLVAAVAGCKGPPDAPKKLEALTSYLFDKTRGGSDEELAAGLVNLEAWLDSGYQDATEGYRVSDLSQASVDALDARTFNLTGLAGAAVTTRIGHRIKPVVDVIAMGDNTRIYGNMYEAYVRDWDTDGACHVARDCLWGAADIRSTADYGLVTVDSTYRSEYRWVETENGWAHLQRTWLLEPIEVLGIETKATFYLGVSLTDGSRTERLQASWAAIQTDLPITEENALNQTIKSLIETEEDIDIWLD
jgi:hypothetical protein